MLFSQKCDNLKCGVFSVLLSFIGSSSSRLLGLVAQWRALGVGAVLSQKLLHPTLRAHLLASGIVPVERLSIRHAQATHALCGGAMIGVAAAPASVAALGQLGSIRLVCTEDCLNLHESVS